MLKGADLAIARAWTINRSLTSDDYNFLSASYDLERSFRFINGNALDISELAGLCDRYSQEAQTYLLNGYLEQWLVGNLGEPSLGAMARELSNKYARDPAKALELFIRALYAHLGQTGYPSVVIKPQNLDIGKIPIGYSYQFMIEVTLSRRGFVWGEIYEKPETTGIQIKDRRFDSRKSRFISIDINLPRDINVVKSGTYTFSGFLKLEGIAKEYHFLVRYEVIPIPLEITPNHIDLGSISYISQEKKGTILVNIKEMDGLKIKGYATSSTPSILKVSPYEFYGTEKIEYRVFPRSSTAGRVDVEAIIEVNGDRHTIPIQFNAGIDYAYLFLSNFPLSIFFACIAGRIRYLIEENSSQGEHKLLSAMVIIGIFYMASFNKKSIEKFANTIPDITRNLVNFIKLFFTNSPPLTRNRKINKNNLIIPVETHLTSLTWVFEGMFVSWVLHTLGYLDPFGTLLVYLIDFISSVFYIIGIQSPSWQWGILTYIGINIYLVINAQIKSRRGNGA